MQEEKKEEINGFPGAVKGDGKRTTEEEPKSHNESQADSDSDYQELPKELHGLKKTVFEFEEDLEAEVRRRGFSDLPVVLDPSTGRAKLRMPAGPHNKVTSIYAKFFDAKWTGHASCRNSDTNVFIDPAEPGRKLYTRIPDIAFWGPAKTDSLTEDGITISSPKELDKAPKIHQTRDSFATVNPDVVFQFCWGNAMAYEEKAIDDMMKCDQGRCQIDIGATKVVTIDIGATNAGKFWLVSPHQSA